MRGSKTNQKAFMAFNKSWNIWETFEWKNIHFHSTDSECNKYLKKMDDVYNKTDKMATIFKMKVNIPIKKQKLNETRKRKIEL